MVYLRVYLRVYIQGDVPQGIPQGVDSSALTRLEASRDASLTRFTVGQFSRLVGFSSFPVSLLG